MANVIVTKENAHVGMKVVRGKDWKWYDQDGHGDGGGGKVGEILYIGQPTTTDGWAGVKWGGTGTRYSYRIGSEGAYDLYIYVPQEEAMAKPERVGEPLRYTDIRAGLVVKLRPASEFRSSMAKLHLQEGMIYELTGKILGTSVQLMGISNNHFDLKNFYIVHGGHTVTSQQVEETRMRLADLERVKPTPINPYAYGKTFELEPTKILKSNTNDTGRNTGIAKPIKVRRPSCTIERGKRRSATGIRCSGSSSGLRGNYSRH